MSTGYETAARRRGLFGGAYDSIADVGAAVLRAITTLGDMTLFAWRTVAWGIALQLGLGVLLLKTPVGDVFFAVMNAVVGALTWVGKSYIRFWAVSPPSRIGPKPFPRHFGTREAKKPRRAVAARRGFGAGVVSINYVRLHRQSAKASESRARALRTRPDGSGTLLSGTINWLDAA